MMKTTIISVLILFLSVSCFSQRFVGKYYNVEKIHGNNCGMSISFKQDSTFEYRYRCHLMKDDAIGTMVVEGNIISLTYTTPDYTIQTFQDTIDTGISTAPHLSKESVTHKQKFPVLGSELRPKVLKKRRNKLIVLEYATKKGIDYNEKRSVYKKSKKE